MSGRRAATLTDRDPSVTGSRRPHRRRLYADPCCRRRRPRRRYSSTLVRRASYHRDHHRSAATTNDCRDIARRIVTGGWCDNCLTTSSTDSGSRSTSPTTKQLPFSDCGRSLSMRILPSYRAHNIVIVFHVYVILLLTSCAW